MRKHATTLIAPLAALAIAGTVTAPAYAGGDHDGHGHHGGHDAPAAQITTSDEATAALADAGVSVDAVDPATAETDDDGNVELTFPVAWDKSDGDRHDGHRGHHRTGGGWGEEIAFEGGIEWTSDAASSTWLDPTVDPQDGQVTFTVDGQEVDALQAVPADDEGDDDGDDGPGDHWRSQGGDHGDHGGGDFDLVLTAEGADAVNQVAGDDAFAEGDVLAETDDGRDC
jgi:hypothetical protein